MSSGRAQILSNWQSKPTTTLGFFLFCFVFCLFLFTTTVSSYVQLPCYIQKSWLLCSLQLPLTHRLYFSSTIIPEARNSGCGIYVPFRVVCLQSKRNIFYNFKLVSSVKIQSHNPLLWNPQYRHLSSWYSDSGLRQRINLSCTFYNMSKLARIEVSFTPSFYMHCQMKKV